MKQTLTQTFARPMIALALAAGIALSPVSAAPARANNNDAAAFFAALIAMGIVVSSINNGAAANQGGWDDNVVEERPRRAKALPQLCLRTYDTRRGQKQYFSKHCLRKNYARWNQLPERCERTIRARDRRGLIVRRAVYETRCLRSAGYRVTARW